MQGLLPLAVNRVKSLLEYATATVLKRPFFFLIFHFAVPKREQT